MSTLTNYDDDDDNDDEDNNDDSDHDVKFQRPFNKIYIKSYIGVKC